MLSFPLRSRSARANVKRPVVPDAADSFMPGAQAGVAQSRDGWYSSSLELMAGLEVTEDVPLEGLPADWTARFGER
jgi:hypothetical protein